MRLQYAASHPSSQFRAQIEEMVRLWKADPRTKDLPVLMLTGSDPSAARRRMVGLGVEGCLPKPIDFASLLDRIGRFVPLADPALSLNQTFA